MFTRSPRAPWREGTLLVRVALTLTLAMSSIPRLVAQPSGSCGDSPFDRPVCVAFSPDGQLRATGGWDQRAQVWSVHEGTLVQSFRMQDPVFAVAFSPDGRLLATGTVKSGKDAVKLWRVSDWKLVRIFHDTSCVNVAGLSFSEDGRTLIVNDSRILKRFRVPRVRDH